MAGIQRKQRRRIFQDLTGKRFGRLLIIERTLWEKPGVFWLCKCDCGGTSTPSTDNLVRGVTQSCGCLRSELRRAAKPTNFDDLAGRQFGKLTVVTRRENDSTGRATWLCICECGRDYAVNGAILRKREQRATPQACGYCLTHAKRGTAHNFEDLTGRKFGRWTVLRRADNNANGAARWVCRCSCDRKTISIVAGSKMLDRKRKGKMQGCGCWRKEINSEVHRSHGLSKMPEYRIWLGIIKRCENPKSKAYWRYGGAGVTIWSGWRNNFKAFLAYVGPRPSPKHSIDRYPNHKGNYEPGNIRWANAKQQGRNKWNNRRLTHNGVTMATSEWAEQIGINGGTLKDRIENMWDHERALTQPPRKVTPRSLTFSGETLPLAEMARRHGIRYDTLSWRLCHGWSVEDALGIPVDLSNGGGGRYPRRLSP